MPQLSRKGCQIFCSAVGRALGGLNICKFSPPKVCGRIWVSFAPSQATYAMLNYLLDNVWERFGAMDVLKSVVKDFKGVMDEKLAIKY